MQKAEREFLIIIMIFCFFLSINKRPALQLIYGTALKDSWLNSAFEIVFKHNNTWVLIRKYYG